MSVRTRFAPSPTGELHLGNARIAVLNWLYARHCGGRFCLRIEDTDVDRNVAGSEQEIISALRRLGLGWDEGPDVGGDHGPYRQSERQAIYSKQARRLSEGGSAYRCYCPPPEGERASARDRATTASAECRCRDVGPEEEQRLRREGIAPAVRFRVPAGVTRVHDVARGDIQFDSSEFDDFVILKSDGSPTYNFAVVVDDSEMEITHVIRGVGHLANTPRQVMLYDALGLKPPEFLHVPHVLGPDGAPLSKRFGARSLTDYLDAGYDPEALINYLSLLSWSSPSGDEVLPVARLVEEIDLSRIGTSDVRLDPDKLEWLSGEYIRRLLPEQLAERLADHLGPELPVDPAERTRVAAAIQERITTLGAARRFLPQIYPPDPMHWDPEAAESLKAPQVPRLLEAVHVALKGVEDWDGAVAVAAIRVAGQEVGIKGRDLFMPVRAAVTGSTQGPELVDVFAIQGKATTLRVIEQARELVKRSGKSRDGA